MICCREDQVDEVGDVEKEEGRAVEAADPVADEEDRQTGDRHRDHHGNVEVHRRLRDRDPRRGHQRAEPEHTEDVENIAINNYNGIPVRVKDIGSVQMGGDLRLGIFDMDGKGEVVGGIVVMRYNENANNVIAAIKEKMKEVEKGLPEGVTFKTSYDRSTLIQEAIESVKGTLIEEIIAVSIVVLIFLFHWRSAVIILIQLPISVAAGFIFLQMFGISSNIMSLTGIALAIGVVVDDGIVMVENAYRHISEAQTAKSNEQQAMQNKSV